MTMSGTPATIEAVCKISNAFSPPTSINENGNKHSANAQNKRFNFNGSPLTRTCVADATIYDAESKVVTKNKNADNTNSVITIGAKGN
ncbi:Uncharacterised protein [Staphylococcus aureus]|nr:Uncharacterised protein [Staphylococcus aureus]